MPCVPGMAVITRAPKPSLTMPLVVLAFESCSSGSAEVMSMRVDGLGLRFRFDPDVNDEN